MIATLAIIATIIATLAITRATNIFFSIFSPLGAILDSEQLFYKPKLSEKYIPDFIIRTSGKKFLVVEVEHPQTRLFTKQMDETKELREARAQMEKYLSFIRELISKLFKLFLEWFS